MNLVIPHCGVAPQTRAAVDHLAPCYVDTSAIPTAYWRTLCELWAERRTVILLEGDKVPADGALEALWGCERPWCAYPVPMANSPRCADFPTLSAAKFADSLMVRFPDLMERVGERDMGFGPGHWDRLDLAVCGVLWRRAGPVHWHPAGLIEHKHPGVL